MDVFQYLEQKDLERRIRELVTYNSHKNFVQRLINPGSVKPLDLGNGQFGTHMISSYDNIIFPEIIQDRNTGELRRLMPRDAYEYAIKTGEYIKAKTPQEAEMFGANYKRALGWKGHE